MGKLHSRVWHLLLVGLLFTPCLHISGELTGCGLLAACGVACDDFGIWIELAPLPYSCVAARLTASPPRLLLVLTSPVLSLRCACVCVPLASLAGSRRDFNTD